MISAVGVLEMAPAVPNARIEKLIIQNFKSYSGRHEIGRGGI